MLSLDPSLIDQMALALLEGGRQLHVRMGGVADSLYGSLLVLTFSWSTVNLLIESSVGESLGAVLTHLIRFIFLAGFTRWFLDSYDFVFYDGLYQGCVALTSAIAGPQGQSQGFTTAWSVFADLIGTIWDGMVSSPGRYLAGATPLSSAFWTALGGWMITMAFLFVALCVFTVALTLVAVIHIMGNALAGLALALGPFFIPWLLWDSTRELCLGWIRFLFIACFYQVVAVTVLVMAKPVFVLIQQWMMAQSGVWTHASPADSMALALLLVITASILAHLMSHVPQIAAALIGHGRVDTGFAGQTQRFVQTRMDRTNDWLARQIKSYGKAEVEKTKSS
ncbi:type IV secretion system protein [Ferrovum sp.]|uniref:type IV secretion system protein n=1 Tax=Ferrovum sp. TaxID=2609467 RepID=UPI00260AE3D6|nr:type IV secretion system protein [Ferrovum sp.]